MIISASRRTDIPAFYSKWFYNRIKEGFVYVRNPMNMRQVSKVVILPEVTDCIVFWTKNPKPMLSRLNELKEYNYYFHFTLNPYNQAVECMVPRKSDVIDTFKKLSDKIGSKRVLWRYNPVLLSEEINIEYHLKYFEILAKKLSTFTERCTLSFLDNYKKTERNLKGTSIRSLEYSEAHEIALQFALIAESYGIELQSCAGKIDFGETGIKPGRCIDPLLIESITGYPLNSRKDKNQRSVCSCIESIDIGEYDTCLHDCLYCYANTNRQAVHQKSKLHDPFSPLLIGNITEQDIIRDRKVCSLRLKGLFE